MVKKDFSNKIEEFRHKSNKEKLTFLNSFWEFNIQNEPFKLIGTYEKADKPDKNGKEYGFFINVRNLNGDILYYPFNLGQVRIWVEHKENLIKQDFWLFDVKLNEKKDIKNPFQLNLANKVFGNPKNVFLDRIEKEKLIRKIFVETGSTQRDAKNLSNALKRIAGDLYTETERFIFELLQNADDIPNEKGEVEVKFNLLLENLLFLHNGKPFDNNDVESISSIGDSTKRKDAEKTGYKGIGFKSVFADAETVLIRSGNFSFSFDKYSPLYSTLYENQNTEEIPWEIKPIWTEKYRYPKEVKNNNDFFEYPVAIDLEVGNEKIISYRKQISQLFSEPRFILFLRHIKSIEVQGLDSNIKIQKKKKNERYELLINENPIDEWCIDDFDFSVSQETRDAMANDKVVPEKLKEIQKSKLSFACQVNNNEIISIPSDKSFLFTYLPTNVNDYSFPFLVNADFLTTANRQDIHKKNSWNLFLFERVGYLCFEWISKFAQTSELRNSITNLIPNYYENSNELVHLHFNKGYDKAINEIAFLPAYNPLLTKVSDAIVDMTGFSDVIGEKLFHETQFVQKNLIINELQNKESLSKLAGITIFDKQKLKTIIANNRFGELTDIKELLGILHRNKELSIDSCDIRDIVENANLESINNWIETCDEETTYNVFLKELEESYLRKETKERICQIKLFKFSNGKFYSFNEVISIKDRLGKTSFKFSNCFFNSKKTKKIKSELTKLDFVISDFSVEDYPTIFACVTLPEDKKLYDLIAEKCKTNSLIAEEKKILFQNFINEATKFDNVAEGTLKDLHLFCDSNAIIKPLNKLIDSNLTTPSWLNSYKIKSDEFFTDLKPYLVSEQEAIFKEIYLPKQDIILSELTEANEIKSLIKLYQDNQKQFFKEFIIKKAERSFSIAKKTSNTYQVQSADLEARKFIDANCANNLFVLPPDFLSHKEEDGIVKADDLHSLILNFVNADELKEILVDIVKYKAKYQFLQKLSVFKFNTTLSYSKEDYEYKILDLVCSEFFAANNSNQQTDFRNFRNKLLIETKERNLRHSEIPPISNKINIASKEFSLSKILPSTYQNSNLISDLITQFSSQGIPSEKLNALFGVNEEIDINEIFKKFNEQTQTLQNAEQFFFLVYYHKHIVKVDLSKLGFEITFAVFPSDFALETEKLPEYLQEWINQSEIKTTNLESIGIYTENSTLVSLRKLFLTKSDFNVNTIAQDEKLSDGKMLLNTFELLKEKEIELRGENEISVFKEMVRVINSNRVKGQELIIQEEYNFALLEEQSIEWKSIGEFAIYLFNGSLPKIVKLDEVQDYVFYRYNDSEYAVNAKNIYINENEDKTKTLQKVALDANNDFTSEDSKDIELSEVKAELERYKKQEQPKDDNTNSTFLDDVNDFISELEGTEWNSFVPELKNILELSVSHPKEKQKLFNLIAKIKLTKEKNVKFEDSDEGFNAVKIGNEKYFVHSARGAFAYIHPIEILKMKEGGYKMALDFSTQSRIKIYETAEEILELNTNHILAYQHEKTMDELFTFCQANRDANKHLLIIDKNNSGEKSRALLKLLNIEDDYQ